MNISKDKGINAGLICFSCFLIPYLLLALLFYLSTPEYFDVQNIIAFFVGIFIIGGISAFFGYSIAKNSKKLKIISSLIIATVPIAWIILAIISN
jgi:hypothetical protein